MSTRSLFLIATLSLGQQFCAAPQEPSALSSSDVDKKDTSKQDTNSIKKVTSSKTSFNFGGAKVGSEGLQASVQSCVTTGKFFDRKSSDSIKCRDTIALHKVDCTSEGLKSLLSGAMAGQWKSVEDGLVAQGFQIDQCVSCPKNEKNDICGGLEYQSVKVLYVKPNKDNPAILDLQSAIIPL